MTYKHHTLMNEKEFTTNFTIIKNPFSDFASGGGICFQPDGEELAFVRSHNPACVWTKVIGYDGGVWLYSGYHYEGRIGFLLTKEPVSLNQQIEVKWDTPEGMKP